MSYTYEIEIKKSDVIRGKWNWCVIRSDGARFYPRSACVSEEEARAKAEKFIDNGCEPIYTPPQPTRYTYVPKQPIAAESKPEPKKKWWQRG